jgi:5-methylcytosine-specific restriction enzyme subunit McrC
MSQTIELVEYESRCVRAPAPTAADQELAERLSVDGDLEPRLEVRWLASGKVEVKASSWVGVVRFSALEIRVVPKLVGGTLAVLRMLEYTAGLRLIAHLPIEREVLANGTDLFELIVLLLVEEAKLLIRDGLVRDYRPVDDTLDVMRGRLRMRDQFLRRYGSFHKLDCHFDEYDGDVPENQLLSAALTAAGTRVQDPELRADTRHIASLLSGICDPRTRDPEWYSQRIHYGRRHVRYKSAHELAILVLRGLALTDLFGASSQRITAFMLNMNVIFERFVTRLVENSLAGSSLRASPQETFRAVIIDERSGRTYSSIRPDLVIVDTRTGRAVPIDIKYKLYETRKFSTGDIYQMFLYAYAIGNDTSIVTAGLIYPSATATSGPELQIKPAVGSTIARIRGVGLDVPSALDSLTGLAADSLHAAVLTVVREITGLGSDDQPSTSLVAAQSNG